ncbi:MAG: hypothetical protein KAW14_13560 [Candidatus Aegiribacteria sp.]|nr:hypothetical protein [Candidatus Aegiribacteria sp.]
MKISENTVESLLSVFTQFWQTDRAYLLLKNTRTAGIAMIASVIVISASGYVPTLLINWGEVQKEWTDERMPELIEQDFTPVQADSVIAGEIYEMRGMMESLPLARLIERGLMAVISALAAFGIVFAVENRKVGRIGDFITSAMLSQAAYMLTGVLLVVVVIFLKIPPTVRLNFAVFVPVDALNPSRIHVFLFRFLSSIDIPSIAALLLWGRGLSAILGRRYSWGIRLCFSVYVIGVMLISLPVMFAPAA